MIDRLEAQLCGWLARAPWICAYYSLSSCRSPMHLLVPIFPDLDHQPDLCLFQFAVQASSCLHAKSRTRSRVTLEKIFESKA
jgi:hypothetical protein